VGVSSDAIAGFVGVITGSAITVGFQYGLTLRNERRAVRSARRLVRSELVRIGHAISYGLEVMEPLEWQEASEVLTDTSEWDRYRERLSVELSGEEWETIDRAYSSRWDVQSLVEWEAITADICEKAVQDISAALKLLSEPAGSIRRNP
jgi:hypothetical protein